MTYTVARLDAALDGANGATTHMQLHNGDPGAGGTANVAVQVAGRIAFTLPASAAGASSNTGSFDILDTGDGAYTHITLWDALTGGTHQATGVLTPQESFAGAGTLNVTVDTTAENKP